MATAMEHQDALGLFRACVAASSPPTTTSTPDDSGAGEPCPLATATHLVFNLASTSDGPKHVSLPLTTSTRFISEKEGGALDLLSVYFCWLSKDKGVGDYITATERLNSERSSTGLPGAKNLVFVEKLDLVNWLGGEVGDDESEFIKSVDDNAATARQAETAARRLATGTDADGDTAMGGSGDGIGDGAEGSGKMREDERLREIYSLERTMGDRNTVLRGIKPTDFSHVRKYTDVFLRRSRPSSTQTAAASASNHAAASSAFRSSNNTSSGKSSNRRIEPIILVSPSASSLLRLANIKSFLGDGVYTPPPTNAGSGGGGVNMLQVMRPVPSVEPSGRALRFVLVESPEQFKPDYWTRVVAVFTTGQAWQFKGYKWPNPADLFSHTLGVYVGWTGDAVPESVKGWGRGVVSVSIDKWREGQTKEQRWRDRETVEMVWNAIESTMRKKGWGKDGQKV